MEARVNRPYWCCPRCRRFGWGCVPGVTGADSRDWRCTFCGTGAGVEPPYAPYPVAGQTPAPGGKGPVVFGVTAPPKATRRRTPPAPPGSA